ncbi:membrane-associated HD superfamily phosphohydrolase [Mucilaginibacter rubeus]|uniref:hypothetical protein n=1 Tax=Mucilaginibacter rubeus TaxID=2027860 RepID=UPI0033958EBC
MIIAIWVYPGGSMYNEYAVGFDWKRNFISNLFGVRALNGAENTSRIWAYAGMILFPVSYAMFFINMAKKIPDRNVAYIIKYMGIANILFTFFTVTPWHDLMLIISTSLFWTCLFIITVFILKTKLHLFKFLCVVCLLFFYYTVYLWAISDWNLLPITQKINFVTSTLLILGLEYFTKQEDFAHTKAKGRKELMGNN